LDMLVYSSQLSYGSKKFYSLSKENRFYQWIPLRIRIFFERIDPDPDLRIIRC
jgi:hypothetical protein